jgi:hypothetical protein
VTLHAAGNPDMRQYADIAPKKTVKVLGIEEACKAVKAYQYLHDMGCGNCAKSHGVVWQLQANGKRKSIGRVHYNGRFETHAQTKAWEAEIKAKYATSP